MKHAQLVSLVAAMLPGTLVLSERPEPPGFAEISALIGRESAHKQLGVPLVNPRSPRPSAAKVARRKQNKRAKLARRRNRR